ncbi:MAG: hypothetical protein IIA40_06430 [SAR324 cluster bacterium]|nr:hypothetical protein [SAR324 cluster bacterium]
MAPLLNAQLENVLQQRTLGNTRDASLPKLLSAEVRVKEAERIVARTL